MNVEEGVFKGVGVEGFVELLVVLVAQLARLLGPSGLRFIDNVGLFDGFVLRLFAFSGYVHALLFFATLDGNAHKTRVLLEQLLDFVLLQELFALAVDVQDDLGAAVLFGAGFEFKFGRTVTRPMCAFLFIFGLPGQGLDFHLAGYHKAGVEAQSKMANHGAFLNLAFVLLHKFFCARKGHVVDVLLHLVLRHADASVHNAKLLFLLVDVYLNGQITRFALEFAQIG